MGRAPRFKAKAYDAPEAVALRQEQSAKGSKIVELSKRLASNEGLFSVQLASTSAAIFATVAALLYANMAGFTAWIPLGGFAALTSTIWLPNYIALPSNRGVQRALSAADSAAAKEAHGELQQWLNETYGLAGKIEDNAGLVDASSKSIPIELYTEDEELKVDVKAKLKRFEDGSFELCKESVKDPAESAYFTPIQGNEITANRRSPLELTAERS